MLEGVNKKTPVSRMRELVSSLLESTLVEVIDLKSKVRPKTRRDLRGLMESTSRHVDLVKTVPSRPDLVIMYHEWDRAVTYREVRFVNHVVNEVDYMRDLITKHRSDPDEVRILMISDRFSMQCYYHASRYRITCIPVGWLESCSRTGMSLWDFLATHHPSEVVREDSWKTVSSVNHNPIRCKFCGVSDIPSMLYYIKTFHLVICRDDAIKMVNEIVNAFNLPGDLVVNDYDEDEEEEKGEFIDVIERTITRK